MYTESELKAARKVIARYAEQKGIPEEKLRSQMREIMISALNSGDPNLLAQFRDLQLSGTEPTEDEIVAFLYRSITDSISHESLPSK